MLDITLKDLRRWLDQLPPEADNAVLTSCVHGNPFGVKRIVLRQRPNGEMICCVNSMGTHLKDEFYTQSVAVAEELNPLNKGE